MMNMFGPTRQRNLKCRNHLHILPSSSSSASGNVGPKISSPVDERDENVPWLPGGSDGNHSGIDHGPKSGEPSGRTVEDSVEDTETFENEPIPELVPSTEELTEPTTSTKEPTKPVTSTERWSGDGTDHPFTPDDSADGFGLENLFRENFDTVPEQSSSGTIAEPPRTNPSDPWKK